MLPQPNPFDDCEVISEPDEVAAALQQLSGLSQEILLYAAEEGERGRQTSTDNHPVTRPGTNAYYETVRGLRDRLLPLGWDKKCEGGSELTISPDGTIAIVAAAGVDVGQPNLTPTTKNPKGRRLREAAEINRQQATFIHILYPADAAAVRERLNASQPRLTYLLLVERSEEKLSVELALLRGLSRDSRANEYSRRIIIGDVPLDGHPEPSRGSPAAPEPDIDVFVVRRSA